MLIFSAACCFTPYAAALRLMPLYDTVASATPVPTHHADADTDDATVTLLAFAFA